MRYLLCILFCMAPLVASATTVISLSIEKMAKESDVIVRGVVTQKKSEWNKARTRIYTLTTLQVGERLKGGQKIVDQLTIRQLGGEIDGIGQMVVGNARFSMGEEVLVFLEKHPTDDVYVVLGMAQGKYSIDRSTTPPSVRRNMKTLHRVPPGQKGHIAALAPTPVVTATPTLLALTARIKNALNTQ